MSELSVIIATRDRAGYLDQALRSLGAQTNAPSFEVVIVDNGSRDATAQIVERAREQYAFETKYVYEERPNRGAARNRGIYAADGRCVVFVDDDVWAPAHFLAAHAAAHRAARDAVVSGPILNVPSYHERPRPALKNYSRAFFCTCNVSVERDALLRAGAFDEQFHLYGWEDTELGVRLRELGQRWKFAWDAYLYHIKPPEEQTLDASLQKTVEKARMAARFVKKNPSRRARMATGAYGANFLRVRALTPEWMFPIFAGVASNERLPSPLRSIAKAQLLDGLYVRELQRGLRQ
ncbi:MAG: glycosyltransferase family 2 protein [Candidatus Eremiobacteraeota bacterium]|nr:glycosyltransferase family 2 protein [Candidatus Eremiobacteraeota bacterium]